MEGHLANPLAERFHRAELRADLMRPAKAEALLEDGDATRQYLDAVEDHVTAFNVAESKAIRGRRNAFTKVEQRRLTPARSALRFCRTASAQTTNRAAIGAAHPEHVVQHYLPCNPWSYTLG